MTALVLLIRHAAHDHIGHMLSGRMPGVSLSEQGRKEAELLATNLADMPIARLHTSPVQRARETALAIAGRIEGLVAEDQEALEEIDYGTWTGRPFAELQADPRWMRWNRERGVGMAPCGESMVAVQRRAWRHLEETAARHPDETVAMVTHCDIIRALIVQILALPLDAIHRFDIDPASISRVVIGPWGARVLSLNEGVR